MSTHETEIHAGRWRIRLVAVIGVGVLALTAALLVFPVTWFVLWVFGLAGASVGRGGNLLLWSIALSLGMGLGFGLGVYVWSLARAERRALELVRAWPIPGLSAGPPVSVAPETLPRVQRIIDTIAIAAGVTPPSAAVVVDDAPNCLSIGRTPARAWIVVTTGLLELPHRELEAVLAYEIGRVAELDVSLDTVVYACTARSVELWAVAFGDLDDTTFITAPVALLVTPVVACGLLLRALALRNRARLSDGLAVRYCRDPVALAAALRRIWEDPAQVRHGNPANAHLWLEYPHTRTSKLFLRTHRILPHRVERIERLARLR
jgi:Zn-dependent protease with chaperone function